MDFTRPVFNRMDYRFFMPEIQHPECISAAARSLEAAAQPCHGAENGSSALLMGAHMLGYLHHANGAEYEHILSAPDGSINSNSCWSPEIRKAQEQEGQEDSLTDVQSGANP